MNSCDSRAYSTPSALTGDDSSEVRDHGLRDLKAGRIRCVFSVEVLGEGVDVPDVDTVLLLRPTQSATLFTQQLGRGPRRTQGKSSLTVLDLIGQQHREFRFDERLTAILDSRRGPIVKQVEQEFPFMPVGCTVDLDRRSQEIILENLRAAVRRSRWATLVADLRSDSVPPWPPRAVRSARRRLRWRGRRLMTMLAWDLGSGVSQYSSLDDYYLALWMEDAPRQELVELLELLDDRSATPRRPSALDPEVPLVLHARYTRTDVLAALGLGDGIKPPPSREGLISTKDGRYDAFFVDLQKAERDYSPTTMYRDDAINRELFHWESQSMQTAERRGSGDGLSTSSEAAMCSCSFGTRSALSGERSRSRSSGR